MTGELETKIEARMAPLSAPCLPCSGRGETGPIFRELQSKGQNEVVVTNSNLCLLCLRTV